MINTIIGNDGKPEYAVIPFIEYQSILSKLEDIEDGEDIQEFLDSDVTSGSLPLQILNSVLDNVDNPIKLIREYRGLTQQQLAEATNLERSYISMVESGKRKGSVDSLKKLSAVLNVDLDLIT